MTCLIRGTSLDIGTRAGYCVMTPPRAPPWQVLISGNKHVYRSGAALLQRAHVCGCDREVRLGCYISTGVTTLVT